jgi:hypothetical protein
MTTRVLSVRLAHEVKLNLADSSRHRRPYRTDSHGPRNLGHNETFWFAGPYAVSKGALDPEDQFHFELSPLRLGSLYRGTRGT